MRKSDAHLDIAEFQELGLLQEVNRRFFHPIGLALAVRSPDPEDDKCGGCHEEWPCRGWLLGQMMLAQAQRNALRAEIDRVAPYLAAHNACGYSMEPTPDAPASDRLAQMAMEQHQGRPR